MYLESIYSVTFWFGASVPGKSNACLLRGDV